MHDFTQEYRKLDAQLPGVDKVAAIERTTPLATAT